ncbi:aquaporin Z [Streptomyces lydicamycinicus]|uniref:Aquaporin Z n=1 Tax=Streptomyces lydicamycinicus TaxID=1546107 RepID=A0A0P4R0M7_9ACTN|nr:aquaporin Z [Streptomyces lydicamycinicus]
MVSPVKVPDVPSRPGADGTALGDPLGAGSTGGAAAAVGLWCGFRASSRNRPATVAVVAAPARCTVRSSSERERLVVDTAARHPGAAQGAPGGLGHPRRPAHIDVTAFRVWLPRAGEP